MHPSSRRRRRHSDELKAKVVAACGEPGASISAVALAHGLNANLVRKWRTGRGARPAGTAVTPTAAIQAPLSPVSTAPEFVAIDMPAPPRAAARAAAEAVTASSIGDPLIHIELRRGPLHLNVRWPTAAADDCRAWLSELCSGLLK
jgi:transposase